MEPIDELSAEAVECCQQLGSQAMRVSDIIGGKDKAVHRFIQEGMDRVNSRATSNAQRIQKWAVLPGDFSVSGGELGTKACMNPHNQSCCSEFQMCSTYQNGATSGEGTDIFKGSVSL